MLLHAVPAALYAASHAVLERVDHCDVCAMHCCQSGITATLFDTVLVLHRTHAAHQCLQQQQQQRSGRGQ
jgi:hypothetical protein